MKRNFYLFAISLLFVSGTFQMKEVYAQVCTGSSCTWSGIVYAASDNPTTTMLRRSRPETQITILVEGRGNRGGGNPTTGPDGEVGRTYGNAIAPHANIGAILVKTGNIYTPTGGFLSNWIPPTDDIIEFIYNDTYGGFGNNKGQFNVKIIFNIGDLK